jgi:hypothetical protein
MADATPPGALTFWEGEHNDREFTRQATRPAHRYRGRAAHPAGICPMGAWRATTPLSRIADWLGQLQTQDVQTRPHCKELGRHRCTRRRDERAMVAILVTER